MKGYKAILEELLRTAYNVPDGELSELVSKSDEELTEAEAKAIAEKIKGKHRDVITSINKTAKLEADKKLDEKFKAGQRNKAQEFEAMLKEKFSVESDKEGADLIDDISSQLDSRNKTKKDKGDLTDDDVKKHAAFIKMENVYKKQLDDLKKEHETKIKGIEKAQTRKEMFATVGKEALVLFEKMNPVLSEDPERATNQKQLVLRELQSYDYELADGKYYPIYPEGHENAGKRVEDEFGHAVELNKLVEQVTKPYFDFKVANDRRSPNGGGQGGSSTDDKNKQQHSYTGKLPKTQAEYEAMQNDERLSIKDKLAINEHWAKQSAEA